MAFRSSEKDIGDVNLETDIALLCWCKEPITPALAELLPEHAGNHLCYRECLIRYKESCYAASPSASR